MGGLLRVFIGYDHRQPLSYNILSQSIVDRTSRPVHITPLILRTLPIKKQGLTPFTYSRFLVPHLCGFHGTALFLDSDMMFRADIAELFGFYDPDKAVSVVKNEKRFEWASVMLFNCGHDANKVLTPEYVEATGGLHGLNWLNEGLIGSLPAEWNHLVGYDKPRPDAKLVHFTQGVPAFMETRDTEYANEWLGYVPKINLVPTWQELMGNSVHAKPVMDRLNASRPGTQKPGLSELGQIIAKGVGDNNLRHGQMRINMRRGLPKIENKVKTAHDGKMVIANYGPSLVDTWERIRDAKAAGYKLMTTSGAHDFLVDKGVIPDFHAQCDPRPEKPQFVQKPQKETTYLLASVVHPDVYAHLKDYKVMQWHLQNKKEDIEVVKELCPNDFLVIAGSTIGLGAVSLTRIMGYVHAEIHGMDSSNRSGNRHAGPHGGKFQQPMFVTTESGRTFETTAQMVSQAREFFVLVHFIGDINVVMYGDGLLQEMMKVQITQAKAA